MKTRALKAIGLLAGCALVLVGCADPPQQYTPEQRALILQYMLQQQAAQQQINQQNAELFRAPQPVRCESYINGRMVETTCR